MLSRVPGPGTEYLSPRSVVGGFLNSVPLAPSRGPEIEMLGVSHNIYAACFGKL